MTRCDEILRGNAFALAALLVVSAVPSAGVAQTTATWDGSTGSWSDPARWSTNPLFPNNGNGGVDYNAVVNSGAVTLDQDITIQQLTLGGSGSIVGPGDGRAEDPPAQRRDHRRRGHPQRRRRA